MEVLNQQKNYFEALRKKPQSNVDLSNAHNFEKMNLLKEKFTENLGESLLQEHFDNQIRNQSYNHNMNFLKNLITEYLGEKRSIKENDKNIKNIEDSLQTQREKKKLQ